MESDEKLRHLVWHAALSLCSPNALETEGKVWGEAREGSRQGDPEAGGYFCLAWHPHIRALDRRLSAVGGAARAGADDLFIIGPPDVVFQAMEEFWQEVSDSFLLQVERSKTEVFTWSGELPPDTPQGYPRAGIMVGGGVPFTFT